MKIHRFDLRGLGLVVWLGICGSSSAQELFTGSGELVDREVDRIYVKGLDYLRSNQQEDGTWPERPYGAEPAVVGLAVVGLLAHGEDPENGPFSSTIRRGLDHLLKNQDQRTGYIGRTMYNHGFATLALAESYGALRDERLGTALKKAIDLILTSQKNNPQKAWRYSPESRDADTTVSGAQMVALFAARNAGLAVPEEAIQDGLKFFRRCQTQDGGFGYTSASGPNAPRTAIGALVFALAKEKDSAAFKSAFQFLRKSPESRSYYHYFLYYASQAFFHGSAEDWATWNRKNIATLGKSQNPDGSWDGQFGATFCTSASLLSLALNYRYLPIYER